MRIQFDKRTMMEKVVIEPGEFHTAHCERIIHTILGSCISVCLKDESTGLAGMNHFLLPTTTREDTMLQSEAGRYGIHAMELLINEMLLRGARKSQMKAKIFGGGHMLGSQLTKESIPEANIRFALTFLEMENIPVIAKDVGGKLGRRISFFTENGKVFVQPLGKTSLSQIANKEQQYQAKIRTSRTNAITLF